MPQKNMAERGVRVTQQNRMSQLVVFVLSMAAIPLANCANGAGDRNNTAIEQEELTSSNTVVRESSPSERVTRPVMQDSSVELSSDLETDAQLYLRGLFTCLIGQQSEGSCIENYIDHESNGTLARRLQRELGHSNNAELGESQFSFSLEQFDGEMARYQASREEHPTGDLYLLLREGTWVLHSIDP